MNECFDWLMFIRVGLVWLRIRVSIGIRIRVWVVILLHRVYRGFHLLSIIWVIVRLVTIVLVSVVVICAALKSVSNAQNVSIQTFTKIALGILVSCFYWLEFYKCFNLVLILAVPLIAHINLAEPIIRVTRHCLERQTRQCSLSAVNWSSDSLYPTRTRTLCLETRACAIIERVPMCPKEAALYNSLIYCFRHEEDEKDR